MITPLGQGVLVAQARKRTSSVRRVYQAPLYTSSEVASYLRLPSSTVAAWVFGQRYEHKQRGATTYRAVIIPADPKKRLLSFENLVEVYVLKSLRRSHKLELPAIRKAILYLRKMTGSEHPLSDATLFVSDKKDLLVEHYGDLVNLAQKGQHEMRAVLDQYLERVDRDARGAPIRLFPFTRSADEPIGPQQVAIDPQISFGRPVLLSAGAETSIIAERFSAGESVTTLAGDYSVEPEAIEEAIRYERVA